MAQTQGGPPRDQEEGFAVAPIPVYEPVTEEGAGLAGLYKYHLHAQNKTSSSSSYTGFGGFITGNRSWGAGVAQNLYFKGDLWRVRAATGYADVRYNYYGIGTAAGEAGGNAGISVLMHQRGVGTIGEVLYRFDGLWYGGALYRFVRTKSSFRPNPEFPPSQDPNPRDLDIHVGLFGPRIARDSRDDVNYPREGSLFDLRVGLGGKGVGSELKYQTYDVSYSKYINVAAGQVLAVRGATCFTRGSTPFFDECLVSTSQNLRGYRASRYRDDNMLAAQAEYRWEAWKHLGFVAFGGAGEVGPKFQDFNTGNILPGGGVGVRYRITRENHVNLRFDYAWGKSSHEAYFFIGEAF
jgi:outer membrane protein assembly factor BamA